MAKPRWKGDELWYLLNLTLQQLEIRYPDYERNTLKGKRAYWRRKIERGEMAMPDKPVETQPEPTIGANGKLKNTWEVAAYDREAREFVTTTLSSFSHSSKVEEVFLPAEPANITQSKVKPVKRDHKVLFVFSDTQIDYRRVDTDLEPIHDERAIGVAHHIAADLQPDEIISLGDTIDLAALSRFSPDSDHFYRTIGPSFQRVHDMYAQFRADCPHAKITEVDSNHNTRLKKFVLQYSPSMYGVKQAGSDDEYPVLSYPYLANLGKLGVNWVSGYGAAEYIYGSIVFKHGTSVVSSGSTAAKELRDNPEMSTVRGHTHRAESVYKTNRDGSYTASIITGALCSNTGEVPSYHSAVDDLNKPVTHRENWQQSVLVIYDYNGEYQFDHVMIRDGKANYLGKTYVN